MELRSEMLRKKKGLVNMHEERNFHLTTVGGLSTIMSLASSGIGMPKQRLRAWRATSTRAAPLPDSRST